MFTLIWKIVPGNTTTKAVLSLFIAMIIFIVLMQVVFPYIEPILFPPSANTMGE